MTEFDISGVGVWSEYFSDWDEACNILAGGGISEVKPLQPELIPAKERRRAPLSVKMAVEVMDQACRMGALEPSKVATVFASVYGDMQITDYMCKTLATAPRTISPTKFHNSVHNASTGYWSIAAQSHRPANAISAFLYSGPMAILEAAVQAVEENIPVLVAVQEVPAPIAYRPFYNSEQSFSAALLLTPPGYCADALASVRLAILNVASEYPELPIMPGIDWSDNCTAKLLPLFAALATHGKTELQFPISARSSMSLVVDTLRNAKSAHV